MNNQRRFGILFLCAVAVIPAYASPLASALQILRNGQPAGLCPLRHTDAKAGISGFIARVLVTQDFQNPSSDKIEVVYCSGPVASPNFLIIEVEGDREASGAGFAPLVGRGGCWLGGCFSRRADGKY